MTVRERGLHGRGACVLLAADTPSPNPTCHVGRGVLLAAKATPAWTLEIQFVLESDCA